MFLGSFPEGERAGTREFGARSRAVGGEGERTDPLEGRSSEINGRWLVFLSAVGVSVVIRTNERVFVALDGSFSLFDAPESRRGTSRPDGPVELQAPIYPVYKRLRGHGASHQTPYLGYACF